MCFDTQKFKITPFIKKIQFYQNIGSLIDITIKSILSYKKLVYKSFFTKHHKSVEKGMKQLETSALYIRA